MVAKVRRRRAPNPQRTWGLVARMVELRRAGLSCEAIAVATGTSPVTVESYLRVERKLAPEIKQAWAAGAPLRIQRLLEWCVKDLKTQRQEFERYMRAVRGA